MTSLTCFAAGCILGTISYLFYYKIFKRCWSITEIIEKEWKKDTVYLYQFPRPRMMSNYSPYCMKIETFCRLYKIPVEVRYTIRKSKYGLLPFVELNGEHIADSQLIMLHLQKHFNIPELSERDEAIARAVDRMVDTHTAMAIEKMKYIDHPENIDLMHNDLYYTDYLMHFIWLKVFPSRISDRINVVLGGKFDDEDMRLILNKDLAAFTRILGEKKFLLGDEPSWVDCTVFSHLATLYYFPTYLLPHHTLPDVFKAFFHTEHPVLFEYIKRTVEKIYGFENFVLYF